MTVEMVFAFVVAVTTCALHRIDDLVQYHAVRVHGIVSCIFREDLRVPPAYGTPKLRIRNE